ncbi:hypothetical protein [Notoacmeibacter sp. MSK16QG-6]|uniref:hypothetical protein n=1 Tax=Notoacmeibacter sp. MSK16QG-6 TaxID=2957982 RepID=UPI00209CEE4B|nr:hypothetical protein [Notoacmeibacter sp. MSK16QG-6]MCP1199947.1 hypothetical protein [Notoacmeibacter sp. MSK16QG-6]
MNRGVDLTPLNDRTDSAVTRMGFGILRAALLFGTAGVMLALFLAPMADRKAKQYAQRQQPAALRNIDMISTGSVRSTAPNGNPYILRRSVLSPMPEVICLHAAGETANGC